MTVLNNHQIRMFHALLHSAGVMENKRDIIHTLTNGRTTSSRQINQKEFKFFLEHHNKVDTKNSMRRKIFALARECEIIYGNSHDDMKMNIAKVNAFLLSRGTVKKKVSELSCYEIKKVINQFQCIVKSNQKSSEKKNHFTEVNSVLEDLNIKTTSL